MVLAYPEPALAVLGLNLLLVGHPVPVPLPEGSAVVNTGTVSIRVGGWKRTPYPAVSMLLISKPALSMLLTKKPRGVEASAPGKMYLFMKRPQTRSSYCQDLRRPAI